MIFNKKAERLAAQSGAGRLAQGPWSLVWRRFKANRAAFWSLRALYVLGFVALFGDFMANEKPIYCKLDGERYFPVLKQYAVDLHLAKWDERFLRASWNEHAYEAAIFPPIPYSFHTIDSRNNNYKSPFGKQEIPKASRRHWLGTDQLGHDVAAIMVEGTRVAMLVGMIAMSFATVIGILLGALAGYFGNDGLKTSPLRLGFVLVALFLGWFYAFRARQFALSEAALDGRLAVELAKSIALFTAAILGAIFLAKLLENRVFPSRKSNAPKKIPLPLDGLVMRSIEVLNAMPGLLLLLAMVSVLQKSSIFYVMAIIGLIRWTGIARYTRAEVLKTRNMGFVEAARAMGLPDGRILLRHALPNAITPVLITIAFGVASAVLMEASLSFLGIGVGDETATWGKLLSEARRYPPAWWLAVFPGGAIFVTVTALNLVGDGLMGAISQPSEKNS